MSLEISQNQSLVNFETSNLVKGLFLFCSQDVLKLFPIDTQSYKTKKIIDICQMEITFNNHK